MKRIIWFLVMALALISASGCSNAQSRSKKLGGEQPPKAKIQIGERMYETKLGTYCWTSKNQGRCVDTISPVELLKGENLVTVQPDEVVKFVMDFEPKPNKYHVEQINEGKRN